MDKILGNMEEMDKILTFSARARVCMYEYSVAPNVACHTQNNIFYLVTYSFVFPGTRGRESSVCTYVCVYAHLDMVNNVST